MTMHADNPSEHRATLVEHLIEFRRRLMIACVAYLAAVGVCYYYANRVYAFLVHPLAASFANPEAKRLIYTGLAEAFATYVHLALFAGFFLAFPVIAAQFYLFLAPGLYKRERRVLLPYLVASPLLFATGAALAYYYIFPLAWKFFIGFETPGGAGGLPIQLEARVADYLSLAMSLLFAFGCAFQLPVILTLLTRFGLVRVETLAKGRRYAIVLIVIAAAVLTPPDVMSQIALSIPLYLLYEMSLWLCRWVEKKS